MPDTPLPLFNRELSWLQFNRRVLAEAQSATVPLLERIKFLGIASNNLDEFLGVRIGALREVIAAGLTDVSPDGRTPKQQLKIVREHVKQLQSEMYATLDGLLPELRKHGIHIERVSELSKKEQNALRDYFDANVAPVLTPLAVDPGHPFPFLTSGALNVASTLEGPRGERHVVFVTIPKLLPRLLPVLDSPLRFLPLESLLEAHLGRFFPGLKVKTVAPFRVIRNADIPLPEDDVQDLLKSVESEVRMRERREVVWLEIGAGADEAIVNLLIEETSATREDLFLAPGPLKLADLMNIYGRVGKSSLKEAPFNPRIPSQLASSEDIFSIIRKGDVLLHRPFDSFTTVIELLQSAAEDPDVVAIKQTLYRTETGSLVVDALARAAERGKQVTAVVELQARFDEQRNILWARRLEEAGVQVVYGMVGMKTHSKVCLVIRREGDVLRRYVHLSTGNYNSTTAKLYTDLDLLTTHEEIAEDTAQFMNLLSGYSLATVQEIFEKHARAWKWRMLVAAPMDYHDWTLRMIEREAQHAREGRPAQIVAKMNSLVEPRVIEALYQASQAGVKIDLIIRGICCLVPGQPGISNNIRVISIVDRFLEHTRVFLFRNGGETELWLSSGDWMPRNFFRRLELTFPVLAPALRDRLEKQILATYLADNVKAWKLQPDGTYVRRAAREPRVRSQERFIEIARTEAVRVGPYDEAIRRAASSRRKAKRPRKKEKSKS
ncbi:MAG TPA: polyphosphate kinase 1 [Thermoanaerobaculia bacterium]